MQNIPRDIILITSEVSNEYVSYNSHGLTKHSKDHHNEPIAMLSLLSAPTMQCEI